MYRLLKTNSTYTYYVELLNFKQDIFYDNVTRLYRTED